MWDQAMPLGNEARLAVGVPASAKVFDWVQIKVVFIFIKACNNLSQVKA